MTSLKEEFLEDFGEDENNEEENEVDDEDEKMKDNEEVLDIEKIDLNKSKDLSKYVEEIQNLIKKEHKKTKSTLKEDPEYEMIKKSNKVVLEIEEQIEVIHIHLKELYKKEFSDLSGIVLNGLDYARVVLRIIGLKDLTKIDMSDILPSSIIMVLKITFATKIGDGLTNEEIEKVKLYCKEMMELDKIKNIILEYVSTRMNSIAPNLSQIVGSKIAAQLILAVGGLEELSRISGDHLQLIGQNKKILAGMSAKNVNKHIGFVGECEILKITPPDLRKKAGKLISSKSILAVRIDSNFQYSDGSEGKKLRDLIEETIKKWQEPKKAKQEKPIKAPDEFKKTKRGGKNARKLKEIYQMTEIREKYNRVKFGEAELEIGDTGIGMGMLGIEGNGSLRLKETKVKKKQINVNNQNNSNGMTSSIIFTPVQGLALISPKNNNEINTEKVYFKNLLQKKTEVETTDMPPPSKKVKKE
jgi:U4/U6 small nuclear ribonucleoprotein PRP31